MRIRVLNKRILTLADRRTSVRFKAGSEVTTRREWGAQLVSDGDAVEITAKTRDPLDHDGDGRKGGSVPKADD